VRYLLGVLVLALAAVLVAQWRDWPPPASHRGTGLEQGAADAPVASHPLTPADLLDPPAEKADYLDITERPLFLPDRRPPAEQPEVADSAEETAGEALDGLDVTAIVITPAESVAWVRSPAKPAAEKLRLGDELHGWTVKAIEEDAIELERQGESSTLVLRDYANSPPSAARPLKRAAPVPDQARGTVRRPATGPANSPRLPDRANNPSRSRLRQPRTSNDAQPRR
jgi:hypothetical protein